MYEALFRLLLEKLNKEYDDMPFFNDITVEHKFMSRQVWGVDEFWQGYRTYEHIVLDYVEKLSESEGSLVKFWLSFIEMAKKYCLIFLLLLDLEIGTCFWELSETYSHVHLHMMI